MTIRYAAQADLASCLALDGHLPEGAYAPKLAAKQVYILSEAGEDRALLRWGLFLGQHPLLQPALCGRGSQGPGLWQGAGRPLGGGHEIAGL